jgi:hypothetical protein
VSGHAGLGACADAEKPDMLQARAAALLLEGERHEGEMNAKRANKSPAKHNETPRALALPSSHLLAIYNRLISMLMFHMLYKTVNGLQ